MKLLARLARSRKVGQVKKKAKSQGLGYRRRSRRRIMNRAATRQRALHAARRSASTTGGSGTSLMSQLGGSAYKG